MLGSTSSCSEPSHLARNHLTLPGAIPMGTAHSKMSTSDTDAETAALIAQLQLEDCQELFAAIEGKGKGKEGEATDSQIALQFHREELERNASIVQDRLLTGSIARACQTDGELLAASASQEQTTAGGRRGHGAVPRLGGVDLPAPTKRWTIDPKEIDDELLAKLSALYIGPPETDDSDNTTADDLYDDDGNGESSAWAAARKPSKAQYRRCIACQENVKYYDIARVPCNHEYCRDCLQSLFKASMNDESLFPPKCCRELIVSGGVRIFLTLDLVEQYEEKRIEFDTANRIYCADPACASFIAPVHITADQATCDKCRAVTCAMCKAARHDGDCPADTALQLLLDSATKNGWQRCRSCQRLVELDVGCNHITCHCSAQFCYVCGKRWKTCRCPQWDEGRILQRANVLVDRQPHGVNRPRRARVAAAVQNLRDRHNCGHQQWTFIRGQHQCEECRDLLRSYILECQQCQIRACNRCRLNRL